uniref:Protein MIX23 n=1 Tax=Eptatretus burgeri TaxID=7764 RepID=A0A8C4QX68_EPTBU
MLNQLRTTDDRIVHELNVSVPTASISALVDPTTTCKQLYMKLQEAHQTRAAAIRACVTLSSKRINELNDQRESDHDDLTLRKELRNEQLKPRVESSTPSGCGQKLCKWSGAQVGRRKTLHDGGFLVGDWLWRRGWKCGFPRKGRGRW